MWADCDLVLTYSFAVPCCWSSISCRHGTWLRSPGACRAPLASPHRKCLCSAKPSKEARSKTPGRRQSPKTLRSPKKDGEGAGLGLAKWNFFSPAEFKEVPAWDVPWGWQTIVFGMLAWGLTFILTGLLSLPISVAVLDIESLKSLTAMQQSEIQLFDQVCGPLSNAQAFDEVAMCPVYSALSLSIQSTAIHGTAPQLYVLIAFGIFCCHLSFIRITEALTAEADAGVCGGCGR